MARKRKAAAKAGAVVKPAGSNLHERAAGFGGRAPRAVAAGLEKAA